MSLPLKLICINDRNKPPEIPDDKWIKYGETYTLINVQFLDINNQMGFEISEITLDDSCFPYHYFTPERFIPKDDEELEQLDKSYNELISGFENI
tara:strand:+ start:1146 stop:1430 length:285 start_codon:yes stop_codon:yes gene_type:complete